MRILTPKSTRAVKAAIQEFSGPEPWPCPKIETEYEPHFIFIMTPPYSGSTALAQVLNSCHHSMVLQKRCEGQWLVPGMCTNDRWEKDKAINWESVRAVWLQKIQMTNTLVQNIDFFIEKSPPNLVRLDQLIKVFLKHTLIAFNRDPFANCSSRLFRHHNPEKKHPDERIKLVKKLAEKWIFCSEWVRRWMTEMKAISFTYESFCEDSLACIFQSNKVVPEFETIDVSQHIKVKAYQIQDIQNQNERHIAKLMPEEINAISEVLTAETELVTIFDYSHSGGRLRKTNLRLAKVLMDFR